MSVEPGIVDTNVLVYALDADAPQHAAARAARSRARRYVNNSFCDLADTLRILLHCDQSAPRSEAAHCRQAIAAVSSLLAFLHVLPVPAHVVDGLLDLLRRHPVTGGDVFDLHIVATMQANGVGRIYTFNAADFTVFPELSIVTP
jgi:predicted nucleic acid-binding protein